MNSEQSQKVNDEFNKGTEQFSQKDFDEVFEKEDTAQEKARGLGNFFNEFTLLWQLLKDYKSGRYTNVPWKCIAAVGFAMVYLINPFDIIPDVIPIVGLTDDASVFALVLASFKIEIETYRNWRNGNNLQEDNKL
ncbi:MAG: YkvA family protein [Lentisphaeria bacterium]|nr:YkvA family protein [Lentisphaeria bacterium]